MFLFFFPDSLQGNVILYVTTKSLQYCWLLPVPCHCQWAPDHTEHITAGFVYGEALISLPSSLFFLAYLSNRIRHLNVFIPLPRWVACFEDGQTDG